MSTVFLLWHSVDPDDDEVANLLGVYSTRELANDRITRSRSVAGFADYPDGFLIAEYIVDKDEWTEGFELIIPQNWVGTESARAASEES